MKQDNLALGRELRDAGMEQVIGHQPIDWAARYRLWADRYLATIPRGTHFTGEDMRAYALSHGLEQPTHVNAWSSAAGGAVRAWLKAGTIKQDGAQLCKSAAAHARLIRVYLKLR